MPEGTSQEPDQMEPAELRLFAHELRNTLFATEMLLDRRLASDT
jgi:hypothetical protein